MGPHTHSQMCRVSIMAMSRSHTVPVYHSVTHSEPLLSLHCRREHLSPEQIQRQEVSSVKLSASCPEIGQMASLTSIPSHFDLSFSTTVLGIRVDKYIFHLFIFLGCWAIESTSLACSPVQEIAKKVERGDIQEVDIDEETKVS